MPNQRAKHKQHLGGFVSKEFHAQIVRLAEREGMDFNRFGFAEKLMREALAARKKRAPRAKG